MCTCSLVLQSVVLFLFQFSVQYQVPSVITLIFGVFFNFVFFFFDMPTLYSLLSFHLTYSLGLGSVFLFCFVFLLELFNSRVINGSNLCTLVRLEWGLAFDLINITEQHLLCYWREYCCLDDEFAPDRESF